MLKTKISKEEKMALARVLFMHYLLYFRKGNKNNRQTLINTDSKVNAMKPAYALKLDLKIRRTNVETHKIDGSIFETFGMLLASF